MTFSPSGQACAHGLFERGARSVGVQQNIGIARLNVYVAALLGNNVEQRNAAISVGLANDLQIFGRLVAHAATVNGDSFLPSAITYDAFPDPVHHHEAD